MTPRRDHSAVTARVENLRAAGHAVEVAATVGGHPLHVVRSTPVERPRPRVVISAGTHGDEPAGVEAALRLLERGGETLRAFEWVVFPCVNPAGYLADTRENGAGVDVNRSFENDAAEEAVALKRALGDAWFDLFVECHEDSEASAFYAFEAGEPHDSLGSAVMTAVARLCPVSHAREIDDMRAVDGVIQVDDGFTKYGYRSMALYMRRFHAERTLTCEAPGALPFEARVAAHTAALRAALAGVGGS